MSAKSKAIGKNIERVFSEELNSTAPIVEDTRPSNLRILISIILSIVSLCGSIFCLHKYKYTNLSAEDGFEYNISILGFYVIFLCCIWFIVDIILMLIALQYLKEDTPGFVAIAILENQFFFKVVFSVLIYSILIKIILRVTSGDISGAEDEQVFENTAFAINEDKFSSFLLSAALFISIFLIERIILQFVNYRIHFMYYRDRIEENEKHIKYLQSLNRLTGVRINRDLTSWAKYVYDCISNGKEFLDVNDFKYYFGNQDGEDMFRMFDIDNSLSVTKDEFVSCYVSLFKEKQKLQSSLNENDECMKKLAIVLTFLAVVIASFLFFVTLGAKSQFTTIFGTLTGFVLPLSFVFGPVLSEMFQSILFIFSVRPFDIGDKITVGGSHYEVREMGLLYTTLTSDSRYHNFPNEKLRKEPVINLRKSMYITETYTKKFDYNSCKEKLDELSNEISKFLKENPKKYKSDFSISDYEILEKDVLKVEIRIKLSCPYQDIKAAKERKDFFTLFLHETIIRLGIEYK
ncbi:putative mechanosensitive ion channel protein [Hamiltosporidium tvaerminnensis]|uniref:Putative mechanosensitive ion channel protein n=1 Tax=Hamiltosporidium tvaerminnensis TaxID=1176355 RepID=A0A4Q9M3D1_9MICR|nr:putative mechanosensitive ion channel protein [Hamiltosporidium tvaerminnensis]